MDCHAHRSPVIRALVSTHRWPGRCPHLPSEPDASPYRRQLRISKLAGAPVAAATSAVRFVSSTLDGQGLPSSPCMPCPATVAWYPRLCKWPTLDVGQLCKGPGRTTVTTHRRRHLLLLPARARHSECAALLVVVVVVVTPRWLWTHQTSPETDCDHVLKVMYFFFYLTRSLSFFFSFHSYFLPSLRMLISFGCPILIRWTPSCQYNSITTFNIPYYILRLM